MKSKRSKIFLSIFAIAICLLFLIPSFSKIIKDDIENIGKITNRNAGSGKLYSTTDEELINKYATAMESAIYIRFIPFDIGDTNGTPIFLYNKNNTRIASIGSHSKFFVEINGNNYLVIGRDEKEFKVFYKEFYSDKNIVNE